MKRELLAAALVRSGAALALRSLGRWAGVMGLNYHRIGRGKDTPFDRALWSASPEAFEEQLVFLKRHTDVIAIDDLPTVIARGRGRYTLITFDDGYRDNYLVAFPLLKRHGLTATFFVSTGFLDSPRLPWWDEIAWMVRTSPRRRIELAPYFSTPIVYDEPEREGSVRALLRAFKAMPSSATDAYLDAIASATETGRYRLPDVLSLWMTWEMVREMRVHGMAIGGHTADHVVLARLSEERQRAQINGCAQRLQAELGEPMRWFSYPVGGLQAFNQATRRCLVECGVEYAFSYYGGVRTFDDWDRYDIRRIAIESETDSDLFRAMVLLPQVFARIRSAPLSPTNQR
jgi:peptidoglycan/xylan/chitin deacetylase (PgdA/CDA1 family)